MTTLTLCIFTATLFKERLERDLVIARLHQDEYHKEGDRTTFLQALDVLSSPLTFRCRPCHRIRNATVLICGISSFSGSIFDLSGINRTIFEVVKLDRQPKNHSLRALRTLRDAWDDIEQYHRGANFYKFITRYSYFLLLAAGFCTSLIAYIQGKYCGQASVTTVIVFYAPMFSGRLLGHSIPARCPRG